MTPSLFPLLGATAALRRTYAADEDQPGHEQVAVISHRFWMRHFGGDRSVVGRVVHRVSFGEESAPVWYEIVGIAGDVKHHGLEAANRPEVYVPYRQPLFASWTVRPMFVVVKSTGAPLDLVPTVRRELGEIDRDQPIADVETMEDRIGQSLTTRRFSTLLLASFAVLALALAAIGIYGVVAYSVTERTHETGVRVALGARKRDVLAMAMRQGLRATAIGIAAGIAAALAAARVIGSLLYGVAWTDPVTFTGIPLLLAVVAVIACYLPARRATRVDPLQALRAD